MKKLSFINIIVFVFLYTTVSITLRTEDIMFTNYKWWIVIGSMMVMAIYSAIRGEQSHEG